MKVIAEELEAVKLRLNAVETETKRSTTFFGRTFTSSGRKIGRKLRIVFDPDSEAQLRRDLAAALPFSGIRIEADDTMLLFITATDTELEAIIVAIKRLGGVLEVDRA